MKKMQDVKKEQISFIEKTKRKTVNYVGQLDETQYDFILLAGSVARGDFMPGSFGGKVDLFVFTKGFSKSKQEIFGAETDFLGPNYYCTELDGVELQIKVFYAGDNDDYYCFYRDLDEAGRQSFQDAVFIKETVEHSYENFQNYKQEIDDNFNFLGKAKEEAEYALFLVDNEYMIERWQMRDFDEQNQLNILTAFNVCVRAIFHLNNEYAPAENRMAYYSIGMEKKPIGYQEKVFSFLSSDFETKKIIIEKIADWIIVEANKK